ncbi:unnamed protein product [Ranitomeya imitator]|uniref:G-protein coupled receptors family 1 profile domain-containing protein n=1 Tax=Ranitomeya imitator TaxID=111125 RepID=A0ABN9LCK4_9NEOB|nr:unnamed protein product [Ranitomeya imitator]
MIRTRPIRSRDVMEVPKRAHFKHRRLPVTSGDVQGPPERYTKMKTATNIYIFNLALADALVTTTMPFQSTEFLMNSWPFGDILCKIVISIDYYNMFTSIFTLTMMSVDRYIAVCHPVKALDFRTPLKAKIINVCIWMLSSSVGISAIVLGGTKISDESTPGQSEDSTCPEEKRGWNPELQKNGETKKHQPRPGTEEKHLVDTTQGQNKNDASTPEKLPRQQKTN